MLNVFRKNDVKSKDYRVNRVEVEQLPPDELESITTILNLKPTNLCGLKGDECKVMTFVQKFATNGEQLQVYRIDFDNLKLNHDYISISRMSINFFGLYPKAQGEIAIQLVSDAYKDVNDRIILSESNHEGNMWGFVGAMCHSIHVSDLDTLRLQVVISDSSLQQGTINGEIISMFEVVSTNFPIQTLSPKTIPYIFDKINQYPSINQLKMITIDMFQKIVKQKKQKWTPLKDILNEKWVSPFTETISLDNKQEMDVKAITSTNPLGPISF